MRQALENTWVKAGTALVFGVIILSFVLFFGPQTQGMGPSQSTWVAKVGSHTIENLELTAAFERYRRRSTQALRLDDAAFADVQRQLALNIAAVELFAKAGKDAGIAVSDQDLNCYLVNWHRGYSVGGERICAGYNEAFTTRFENYDIGWFTEADGSFTSFYTEQVRERFAMSSDAYETYKRNELIARLYIAALEDAIQVPSGEVEATWLRRNSTIDLEYVALNPATINVGDDDAVATWAAANEAAIVARFEAESARYTVPRAVELERIYIRKPEEGTPAYDEARARVTTALERVTTGGEAFDAVARELSEIESEAERGGAMGERTAGTIAADIWASTESRAAGDVYELEQSSAWNVFRIVSIREEGPQPLDAVRNDIARELMVMERAERLVALAPTAESLADAADAEAAERTAERAAALGVDAALLEADGDTVAPLTTTSTGPFALDRPSPYAGMEGLPAGIVFPPVPADEIPGIGQSRELMAIALSLSAEAPLHPELVEVDDVPYLVRLIERTEADIADATPEELAAISNELRGALIAQVIGTQSQLQGLFINLPGEAAPIVSETIESAFANGDLQLHESFFAVPDADPVDDADPAAL